MPRGALSSNLPKGPKACLTGFGPRLRSRDSHTTAPGGLMKPPDRYTQAPDVHAVGDLLTCYLEEPPCGAAPLGDDDEARRAREEARAEATKRRLRVRICEGSDASVLGRSGISTCTYNVNQSCEERAHIPAVGITNRATGVGIYLQGGPTACRLGCLAIGRRQKRSTGVACETARNPEREC
eukprot:701043-Prorocentrum_minimum.AAC.1